MYKFAFIMCLQVTRLYMDLEMMHYCCKNMLIYVTFDVF